MATIEHPLETKFEKLCDIRCPSHSGILAGVCKGNRWFDPEAKPRFAVTYSYCVGGCGVFGEVYDARQVRLFLEQIFIELKRKGILEFEFSCENKKLSEQVLSLFPEKIVSSELEYSYYYKGKPSGNRINTGPHEYTFCEVDSTLLQNRMAYTNLYMLQERLENSWENEESFLANSLAIVAIKENKIVGIIFGSGNYQNHLAIDIEVELAHRRNGIAEELTKLFVRECEKRGYIAQWDCVESNVASQKLAEKVGFELFKKREYYWFEI